MTQLKSPRKIMLTSLESSMATHSDGTNDVIKKLFIGNDIEIWLSIICFGIKTLCKCII